MELFTFERVFPSAFTDKSQPDCPDCGGKLFYIGSTRDLSNLNLQHPLFQCVDCRRVYKQKIKEAKNERQQLRKSLS
jgi:hypothetical protein